MAQQLTTYVNAAIVVFSICDRDGLVSFHADECFRPSSVSRLASPQLSALSINDGHNYRVGPIGPPQSWT